MAFSADYAKEHVIQIEKNDQNLLIVKIKIHYFYKLGRQARQWVKEKIFYLGNSGRLIFH